MDKHPDWINEKFLLKALVEGLDEARIQIVSYDVKLATDVGDHYASDMYKVAVTYTKAEGIMRSIHVIVKCVPQSKEMQNMIDTLQSFQKESDMLKIMLPVMTETLQAKCKCPKEAFGAKCLFVGSNPVLCIVMEDLASSGYCMPRAKTSLDLDHSVLAMKMIAQLHATSAVVIPTNGQLSSMYKESIFRDGTKANFGNFIINTFRCLSQEINSWGDEFSNFASKINNLANLYFDVIKETLVTGHAGWTVLCHGDLKTNNMLFKYDHAKPIGVKFVDFQLSYLNSPAIDLQYFFHTSTNCEVRAQHLDFLINVYNEEYNNTLRLLGYEHMMVSLEDLHKEYSRYHIYGFYAMSCVYPLSMKDTTSQVDADDMMDVQGKQNVKKLYNNKALISVLKQWLPFYASQGVF